MPQAACIRMPPLATKDASNLTSGTLDGDRLPALSATKKGGVPATGTPSGLFLRDDGTWASAGAGGSHASTHQNNGSDEISVAGLSGQLADAQPSTPGLAGADPAGTGHTEATDHVAGHAALTASIHGSDSSGKYPSTPALAGAEAANANIQTHVTGTGSPHTAAGVGAEVSGAVSTHNGLTTVHAAATTIGGKAIPSGGFADASTLSSHTGAAAPHSGHVQVGGQIGGTAASPDVRGLRETTGPTLLTLGSIVDGEYLKRVGATVVSAVPTAAPSPDGFAFAWFM